jgi:hypothetical protein
MKVQSERCAKPALQAIAYSHRARATSSIAVFYRRLLGFVLAEIVGGADSQAFVGH